ncbi:MAG: NTP transferase domain-containing protein [Candidatus Heimdallarchaeota archaeon]|nr:NTP transferase domain-containing protein [Candidatus Heimdallarchaeota archaeon]
MNENFKHIPVIVLAAGDSKRMGSPKGLLNYKGKPFISLQIEHLQDIGFSEIIIVLGKARDIYLDKIPELKDFKLVTNALPERGAFSSILCGLSKISDLNRIGAFILPVDVPCPEKDVWVQLIEGLRTSEANVTIPSFEGKKGHPVFLSAEFIDYLLTCSSDSRLDFEIHKQINQQKAKIISVKDLNITLNLNTIEEWEAFKVKEWK